MNRPRPFLLDLPVLLSCSTGIFLRRRNKESS